MASSTNKTMDKQFDELPSEIQFCKNCVVSNQRPRTTFNEKGLCNACEWAYEKDFKVDWESREKELEQLLDKHRSNNGEYDCIVPGSGGKDSAFVAHQLKHRWGMNPLCCTWSPFEFTTVGFDNLQKFVNSGFSNILGQPDGNLHKKLARLSFDLIGDAWQPFTYGQKSWAFHIAQKWNIKLIFYGENGEVEYGGSQKYKNRPCEDIEDWERNYFRGTGVDKMVEEGLKRKIISPEEVPTSKVNWYKAPHPDEIKNSGMEMHWYSYYQKWVPQENFYYAATHTDFETNDFGRSEGTYTKYASLDDRQDGFHWYLSYIKFGMGRASRDAQQDIRRHHITREEGVALVRKFDGEFPSRHYQWFLDYLGIDDDEFWRVINKYREVSNVWQKDGSDWRLKYVVQ